MGRIRSTLSLLANRVGNVFKSNPTSAHKKATLHIRNKTFLFETPSQVVGPAEPTMILTTMRVTTSAGNTSGCYLEIKPIISLKWLLRREAKLEFDHRFSIDCYPRELKDLIRQQEHIIESMDNIDFFNQLVLNEGTLSLELPNIVHGEDKKRLIATFMCDLIESIEGEYG